MFRPPFPTWGRKNQKKVRLTAQSAVERPIQHHPWESPVPILVEVVVHGGDVDSDSDADVVVVSGGQDSLRVEAAASPRGGV